MATTEHTLNITKIVRHYKQDINVVAKVLYPNVRYPRLALARVEKGEADLSVSQLYRLADFLGIFVTDLLSFDTWKGSGLEDNAITFEKGEYTALIHPNGLISVRKGTDVIKNGIIIQKQATIDDLLTLLNNITNEQWKQLK